MESVTRKGNRTGLDVSFLTLREAFTVSHMPNYVRYCVKVFRTSHTFLEVHMKITRLRIYPRNNSSRSYSITRLAILLGLWSFPPLHMHIDTRIPKDSIHTNRITTRDHSLRLSIKYYLESAPNFNQICPTHPSQWLLQMPFQFPVHHE